MNTTQTKTFTSFGALARHMHQQNIRAANSLRKTQHLRKPGTLAVAKAPKGAK